MLFFKNTKLTVFHPYIQNSNSSRKAADSPPPPNLSRWRECQAPRQCQWFRTACVRSLSFCSWYYRLPVLTSLLSKLLNYPCLITPAAYQDAVIAQGTFMCRARAINIYISINCDMDSGWTYAPRVTLLWFSYMLCFFVLCLSNTLTDGKR